MKGVHHYKEAERLREAAKESMNDKDLEHAKYFNDAAQVHATLAQTAAIIQAGSTRLTTSVNDEWGDVLS